MKRIILLLACISALICCQDEKPQAAVYKPMPPVLSSDFPPNPVEKAGYVLTKADEFNGTALDENLWIPYYLRHRVLDAQARADYTFKNGALVLKIDKNKESYGTNTPFKVSGIQSLERADLHKPGKRKTLPTQVNFVQKFGYFEIRAKVQAGEGNASTFWLVGLQDDATQTGEIDIMEQPGNYGTKAFKFNLYRWGDESLTGPTSDIGGGGWQNKITTTPDLANSFNIYALEWTPTQIKMYFNNQLVNTLAKSPQYPMGVLLTLYQGVDWVGDVTKNPAPYPKEFAIDYFRAYQKK